MISICMPYYDNPGMLELHIDTWNGYPQDIRDQFRFVIVDDASPNKPAADVKKRVNGEFHLFRIHKNVPWGWPAAKNIAMHEIPESTALLTDIDHLLEVDAAINLLGSNIKPDRYYHPHRRRVDHCYYKPHPATWVMQRSLFWKIGGFEENWLGLYGTDFLMRNRAARFGKKCELPSVKLTLWGRSDLPDASTTEFGRKGSIYHKGYDPWVSKAMRKSLDGPPIKVMSQEYSRVI